MNIIIDIDASQGWTGGVNYKNNLINSLKEYIENVKILDLATAKKLSKIKDFFLYKLYEELINTIVGFNIQKTKSIMQLETNFTNSIVFSKVAEKINLPIPIISWIPDFQHYHLKEMFTNTEKLIRDVKFKNSTKKSTIVVLSSKNALNDFKTIYPKYSDKGRVLNFVSNIPLNIFDNNPALICKKYNIPESFIYLPNQFWKHKNHKTVFDAINILLKSNVKPFLVCSGNTNDYRNPEYFNTLKDYIKTNNIEKYITFLGFIPYDDVYKLIRQSKFVVNPSFFEGWSTTVEEVKSIGKSIILSNIDVHKEQNPPDALYFNPNNSNELADKIKKYWEIKSPGADIILENKAQQELPQRMKKFAETFYNISLEAISIYNNKK